MPRAKRICPKPGCPRISEGRYCPDHNREYEQRRGTTAQRGYGAAHQTERAKAARLVLAGEAICSRCRNPIDPRSRWALDHADDRQGYIGPAHKYCNDQAGGRNAHNEANKQA